MIFALMKAAAIFFILTHYIVCTFAQSVSTLIGSRAAGMGYASAPLSDAWALMNNPGGLAGNLSGAVAAAQEIHPAVQGSGRTALIASGSLANGIVSGGFFRFGDEVYNEQIVAVGYGNKIGITSLGARASYVQYHVEGSPNRSALAIAFGGIAKLTPTLSVAAYVDNLNQPVLSKNDHEQLPVKLTAAIALQLSDKFLFVSEIQKDIDYQPVFKTGIELLVHPKVAVRSGINLHPDTVFFGFGFSGSKIKIDYAAQFNALLGAAHQMSVIYSYRRYKKKK